MPPYVLRHPALVVGVAAALGTATIAPTAAMAATTKPAPAVVQHQDLGGLINGLVGSITGLTGSIADQLLAGTLPGILPANAISSLINTLVAAPLTAVTEIVDLLSPSQILQLVKEGPVAATTQLLQGVLGTVTKLTTTLIAGTAQLPLVGDVLSRFTAILEGGIPTAADALKSLTGILDQLTTQFGLPSVLQLPAIGPLIQKLIDLAGKVTDPATKAAAVRALSAAAKTAGIDPATLASLGIAGLGSAAAAAPAAVVKIARARISSVAVGKSRRSVSVKVVCPASAPASGCVVRPSVKLAGSAAKLSRSITVARGTTQTVSAAVPASIAKKVRKSGGRLVVKVLTTGATAGAVTRTVAVPAG
ncbi:hypothetical protein [Patulibacter minatonensis]|uniref:hypothetical protein n=1 Tax=Patulibacter minatonensis TaxID=298163 RepID=UPI00047C3EAE|nr:hypothetical protein [Patulibacter minatonensis]